MKQRLSVRAIIKHDNQTLLLRRLGGRKSIAGQYELPGGEIAEDEQPEDALRRHLADDAGIAIQTSQLFDAVTYVDRGHRDIQYGVLVYLVSPAQPQAELTLGPRYDKYLWQSMKKIQQITISDLSLLLLGIIQQDAITDETLQNSLHVDVKDTSNGAYTIYADGGSRGNPGPSASGYIILDPSQQVIDEGGVYLGITTNNQAEYHGVRLGLERAVELGIQRVDFKLDSMLVVNQMNGIYKIKNRDLWPVHERIRELLGHFEKVTFSHVRREFNQLADGMVNKVLDAHAADNNAVY